MNIDSLIENEVLLRLRVPPGDIDSNWREEAKNEIEFLLSVNGCEDFPECSALRVHQIVGQVVSTMSGSGAPSSKISLDAFIRNGIDIGARDHFYNYYRLKGIDSVLSEEAMDRLCRHFGERIEFGFFEDDKDPAIHSWGL